MRNRTVAGVDWAGGTWLAIVMEQSSYAGYVLNEDFGTLWKDICNLDRILVDVPIGLPEDTQTLADREELDSLARSVTGRSSSVFPVPSRGACRLAKTGEDYETVAEKNQEEISKGLSTQSYSIASAIGEVDEFLRATEPASETVVEAHPEVCFRGFLGRKLQHSKKTAAGLGERIKSLDCVIESPESMFGMVCKDLISEKNEIEADDVVDALGLSTVAWKSQEQLQTLPKNVNHDSEGLPMQMACWSEDPLV